jgi:hypothetical protein
MCAVTEVGRRLLHQLDPKVDALDEAAVGFLPPARLEALVRTLDEIRRANATRGAARTAVAGAGG